MPLRIQHGAGPQFRPFIRTDYADEVSVSYVAQPEYLTGDYSEEVTVDDAVFDRQTSATWWMKGQIVAIGMGAVTFTNLNPSVATIGVDGTVTRITSGVCRVLAVGDITLAINLDLTTKSVGGTMDVYTGPVSGCLAEHLADQVDSRIDSGMTMTANGRIFTTQNHLTEPPVYVRNASLWCADVDLTCISPWNSRNNALRAGTLVTQRHPIFCEHNHFHPLVGDTVRFVAADGTVYDRTLLSVVRHPSYSPYYPDFTIGTLSSDLPGTITPCEVMPADYANYMVYNIHTRPAGMGTDQQEKALIQDYLSVGSWRVPTDSDRLLLYETKIPGDSGNPGFIIHAGALVLVTVWTFGGAGSGTPVSLFIADINTMIASADTAAGVSTGYTVTEADFSAFPAY